VALALLDEPGARIFHLTADRYYTLQEACRRITERHDYAFQNVDIKTFIEHMNRHCGPADALFPLLAFYRTNRAKIEAMQHKRYDNVNYRLARARSQHVIREPDLADTMQSIVGFMQQKRLIPLPQASAPASVCLGS
jgi:hypothetical protein